MRLPLSHVLYIPKQLNSLDAPQCYASTHQKGLSTQWLFRSPLCISLLTSHGAAHLPHVTALTSDPMNAGIAIVTSSFASAVLTQVHKGQPWHISQRSIVLTKVSPHKVTVVTKLQLSQRSTSPGTDPFSQDLNHPVPTTWISSKSNTRCDGGQQATRAPS